MQHYPQNDTTSGNLSVGADLTVAGETNTASLDVTATPGAHAAAPDLAFGDLDTGLWESADDTLKIGTAGTERASINSTGVTVAARVSAATLTLSGLGTYADDATAGGAGLTTGMVYMTVTGELRIKT